MIDLKEESASPPPSLPRDFCAAYSYDGSAPRQSGRLAAARKTSATPSSSFAAFVPVKQARTNSAKRESSTATPPKKRKKSRRLYDDPSNTSYPENKFPPVPDHLFPSDPDRRLDLLVCGLNPGLQSSQQGAHFKHPSNHFWRTLLLGGLTPTRIDPFKCHEVLNQAAPWPSIGLTNICIRPTAEGGELGRADYLKGTPILEEKVRAQAKPRLMVFTGKGIAEWWSKCCIQLGGLPAKKRAKSNASVVQKEEDVVDSKLLPHTVSLSVPSRIPWAATDSLGLGLLDSVIQLDGIDDTDPRSRYCFLFVTTSPSGRVTTMHLPEKGEWMSKVKTAVDWLRNSAQEDGESVMRSFNIVDGAKMQQETPVAASA